MEPLDLERDLLKEGYRVRVESGAMQRSWVPVMLVVVSLYGSRIGVQKCETASLPVFLFQSWLFSKAALGESQLYLIQSCRPPQAGKSRSRRFLSSEGGGNR